RSSRLWELDLGILTDVGITVRRPAVAQRALASETARPAVPWPPAGEPAPPPRAVPPAPIAPSTPRPGPWARLTGKDA
ncbi:MAG: hypothetical protein L0K86_05650, partial [Actinomycetia bacterium]|nr:hypothetical protein [Actinomycetes bacterium]